MSTKQENTILAALLAFSPVQSKTRRHDDGFRLLPMGEWLIEALAARDENGERLYSGRDKAREGQSIKADVDNFRVHEPENWKAARDFYNAEKNDFIKAQKNAVKKMDVRNVRAWRKSGNFTLSYTADAAMEAKVEKWRAVQPKHERKSKKASTVEDVAALIASGKIDAAALDKALATRKAS